jgi:hypothetical protein
MMASRFSKSRPAASANKMVGAKCISKSPNYSFRRPKSVSVLYDDVSRRLFRGLESKIIGTFTLQP